MAQTKREQTNKLRFAIMDFAGKHNLLINPAKGFEPWVESYLKLGYCPCEKPPEGMVVSDHSWRKRLSCPCDFALDDIEKSGKCICALFWKDMATFKKTYG